MRFSGLIVGLLVAHGLAQTTVVEEAPAEPSAVAPPEETAPAPEEPSAAPIDEPSPTDEAPVATADPEESAPAPEESIPAATDPLPGTDVATDVEPTAVETEEPSDPTTAADESSADEEATATDEASSPPEETATGTAEETDDGATATGTSTSSPTSTGAVVDLDLENAELGENAEVVEVEGKTVVQLTAPADGQASFKVTAESTEGITPGDTIVIVASIKVEDSSLSRRSRFFRRAEKTDCSLTMSVDGSKVYEEALYITDGDFKDITSSGVQASENPEVQVTQQCGKKPASLTVENVSIASEDQAVGGGSGGGGGSKTGDADGSSETGSSSSGGGKGGDSGSSSGDGNGDKGSDSNGDNDNAASKGAASFAGLVAAAAAVAFVF
ncbi:hypothetical protein ACJ41O_001676 [Fusarium nematophilum]